MKSLKNKIAAILLIGAISISVSYKSDFFEIAKQIEIYTSLFKELNLYYIDEINPAEVMDLAIEKTLSNLDPYTRYYDEQGVINARITAEGEYGGIGASIVYRNGNLVIREIFEDYPAHKSGLEAGDEILRIDHTTLKDQPEDIVKSMLRGLPNTTLNLQINRQNEILEYSVIRETVEITPVPYYAMINEDVGYISFTKFNQKASREVKNAFEDLKSQGMQKLIIDVRGNPGGLLNEAVKIVNFFIPKNNIVVTTRAKLEKWSNTFKTRNSPLDLEIPLVILIDDRSASASEILAGALQDYDRAVIVGQRSFGKGLVQRSRKLSYGTQLKLTISKYYTPSGRCIQELDYQNRIGNIIPKFSDPGVNSFKTSNGRTVYDGGGIQPDVEVKYSERTEATKQLLNSEGLFEFVTSYYYKNASISEASSFHLKENDFESLKTYLKLNPDSFQLKSEKAFEKALHIADSDDPEINSKYDDLLQQIQIEKLNSLDKNKIEILDVLSTNIANRYYFKKGQYEQKLTFDTVIRKAEFLLQNETDYSSILAK